MKQIVQYYRDGQLKQVSVSTPTIEPRRILVQTHFSAVSLGTEGKKVATAKQNLLGKARSRPDLVRLVIRTARREGLALTARQVIDRLDEPTSLGYSAAGHVIALGAAVEEFRIGDRVACGGASAVHAEIIAVPVNLCARIPDGVSLDHAAFTTIGAIALQGLRQAEVMLGECVAVIGLGLIGQLTAQLLKANGCRVIGIDVDPEKVALAEKTCYGKALLRDDPNLTAAIGNLTGGLGVDAALITAAGSSNDPMELAIQISRDRGRVVVVGGVKMDVPRDECYHKELEIKLSRSYGPGRYDPTYEEKGVDYPIGYVRWTEKRNMEAFLDLLAAGRLSMADLITHRFPFRNAENAYRLLTDEKQEKPAPLGILFEYDTSQDHQSPQRRLPSTRAIGHQSSSRPPVGVGFIGAGSFARKHLIPPLAKYPHAHLVGVAAATGISSENTARKFGFDYSTGDYQDILNDQAVQAVFIATRHNLHAQLAAEALRAGKAVFVEKPLALTGQQVDDIVAAWDEARSNYLGRAILTVGFNRRFAPLIQEIRKFIDGRAEPIVVSCRVNAGFVDGKHWVHDADQGGGRVLGEVCHFIDLASFLVNSPIRSVNTMAMDNCGKYHDDNLCVSLAFADGSLASIAYLANGDIGMPKERFEVYCQGSTAILDDFTRLDLYRNGRKATRKRVQDKGHQAEVLAFLDAVLHGTDAPVPFADCISSTLATLGAVESLKQGMTWRLIGA